MQKHILITKNHYIITTKFPTGFNVHVSSGNVAIDDVVNGNVSYSVTLRC